jgi:hypothetical protein
VVMSNETDILIVGSASERFAFEIRTKFRHWQVYTLDVPGSLYGRRFRRAYYTDGAEAHKNWDRMLDVLRSLGEVRHLDTWGPDAVDFQAWEDVKLLREIRQSRYTDA